MNAATITGTPGRVAAGEPALAPVRWGPSLGVGAALAAMVLALSGRHGYHLDELYTRVAGRHLGWGQIDQPPLVALVARVETAVFGDNLTALRLVPALLMGVTVVLVGLIARELGGSQRAQLLATGAAAVSGLALITAHLLGTNDFDVLVWVAVCWLAIRLARTRDPRLWLVMGVVVGAGLYAKYLLVLLLLSIGVGMLVSGPRRLLFHPYVPAGAAIAALIASPVLIWQATHGWPQFEMADALSIALADLSRISFLPMLILVVGLFLTPFWIAGLVALLRRAQWRPYRFVAVAYLFMIVLLIAIGGQAVYAGALQFVLLAAGCVVAADWARTAVRRCLAGLALAANLVTSAVLLLPVLPIQAYADNPVLAQLAITQFDQAGWPELTAQAAAVYRALPPEDRSHAVFYGNHYGQAGALDKYGPAYGLPPAYSGHNSYADFGRPADDKTVVITIGVDRAKFSQLFAQCTPAGRFTLDLPVSDAGQEFMVCRGPREPWSRLWPRLRWIGFQCPYTAMAVTAASKEGCV
ncbi:glycosyltransferase family 39 protein [Microbispora sp. NEAU-D428]|uniref:glycosyltransferase family 39 protein n=1 Tax=Microbispora sitophila TaxID=2771537 RepID=UPI001866D3DE|nr:glycosyltransferase family 39 protein [Microbispora sitophila]MBE3015902.1 glycosyltransferase family 39 protein [Microbispora sitophila]